ncbi:L-lactate dehydrogenase [Brachybacterium sp. GCM10030252]|uniref:L-lactate dehydrogenase n=1 Tax=Brachybacterium sp. GCM10030252 TaxID=3273380 RepID=UPI00361DA70E
MSTVAPAVAPPSAAPKLAVVGAGSVGSSVAYAAMLRGSARTIALYDVNTAKVDAEVLDLAHGSSLASGAEVIGGDDISVVAGADVVVITAGARQKPGQTRLELTGTNVAILQSLLPQLLEQAPDAVYVLVTNPADVLALAAARISGLPRGRVMSSGTVLDTSRLRWLLATRLGVSSRSVHATIVGEHGDSEFGLWSSASIGQVPLTGWLDAEGRPALDRTALEELEREVAGAAYTVIQGKGATNLAIGVAAARIVEAIVRDENAVLPVSMPLEGWHGLDDVAMSMPTVVGRAGAVRRLEVPMDDRELARMHASAEAMREVQAGLDL